MKEAYKQSDGRKIEGRRVLVDVERGRTVEDWRPMRLGGGLGGETRAPKEPRKKMMAEAAAKGVLLAPPGGPGGPIRCRVLRLLLTSEHTHCCSLCGTSGNCGGTSANTTLDMLATVSLVYQTCICKFMSPLCYPCATLQA